MENHLVGKYIIKDSFKITGRGLVFAGTLSEGNVKPGNQLEFSFAGQTITRRIAGIDMNSRSRTNLTGLLIACDSDQELEDLSQWQPGNVEALIWQIDQE